MTNPLEKPFHLPCNGLKGRLVVVAADREVVEEVVEAVVLVELQSWWS